MDLVELRRGEAVCTSLQVAEKFGKRHTHVVRKIELIMLENSTQNWAECFRESKYKDASGKENKMYYINRDGFTFLVMGFTGKSASEWKWKYIKAFNTMEKAILNQHNTEWIESRKQGKLARREETDAIKEFVQYATSAGSKNADRYYIAFSKMADKLVGITARDLASVAQLFHLSVLENAIANLVIDEMAQGIEYHQIFKDCKARLEAIIEIAYFDRGTMIGAQI